MCLMLRFDPDSSLGRLKAELVGQTQSMRNKARFFADFASRAESNRHFMAKCRYCWTDAEPQTIGKVLPFTHHSSIVGHPKGPRHHTPLSNPAAEGPPHPAVRGIRSENLEESARTREIGSGPISPDQCMMPPPINDRRMKDRQDTSMGAV